MNEKKNNIKDAYARFKKDPLSDTTDLLKSLNHYKDSWLSERQKSQDTQWRNNLAFYSGNHYIRDIPQNHGYRVRLRENHVNNIMNRMLSIFVQNMPVVRVFANSTDFDDDRDAKSTENFIKYQWRIKKLEQAFIKLPKYAAIFGSAFTYRAWDPDAGGSLILDPSETGNPDYEMTSYRGDSCLKVVDPMKTAFRPGIESMDDHYDCIYMEPVNRCGLESKYGEIDGDSARGMNIYNGGIRQDDDLIMLNHYYHKPTPWFPEGLYACWAGKKLLKVRESSPCETKLPLEHLPFDQSPLKFYGTSSIEQVMDLQEQLNRAAGMIVEARNLIAKPRVLASNEAQVPAQSITDRPGDIIRYKAAGGAPQFIVPNFNFAEMANHKADLRNALSMVAGITSASRGEIPAATRTALALQLVLEQDRSQFLPFIKNYHQVILDSIVGILEISAENIAPDDARVIKINQASGTEHGLFHGGMVPSPLDAYLEDTNPLGWTAAGRVEQIGHLIDRGVLKDRNQVLEMLSITSADPAFETININKQAAQKEIVDLNSGKLLDIGPEDDDSVHLDEHIKIVAAYSFRDMARASQDAHIQHIEQHKARISSSMPQGAPVASQEPKTATPKVEAEAAAMQNPTDINNIEQLLAK